MNSHLPLGVFINEETAILKSAGNNSNSNSILSSDKLENPPTPIEETAPMSNNSNMYNVQSPDEYPNSVESCAGGASSVALETIAPTP